MTQNLYPHVKCPECQLLFTPEAHDDKIKDLEAENQRLRESLRLILIAADMPELASMATKQSIARLARAALGGGE